MQTSGTGREGWMTTVPLLMLVLFVAAVLGGPRELLRTLESYLGAVVTWVTQVVAS
jgi:hypothetical protein